MVGGRAGVNFGTMTHPTLNLTPDVGIEAGIIFEAATSRIFSLQPEVNLVLHRTMTGGEKINMTYVDVPILFKFSTGNKWRLFANVGPTVSLLLNVDGNAAYTPFGVAASEANADLNWYDYYRERNIGLTAGLGFAVDNFLLEGRYMLGGSNLSAVEDITITTSRFNMTAAYILVF
ncbi:hypothetical protein GCM10023331_01820 [Algivirga pacifica]|uniref:Outer membrane protein beta-barrel domain-containing protein n=2 Tax=Algivirga pacifica TaxID=1162670 RepID=A0ABP9CYD0_9BACT